MNMKEEEVKKAEKKPEKLKEEHTKASVGDETEAEEQEERNGIIPEGLDFRKFIGCGG
ncbi:MAG: hypothetical protein ACJAT1_001586 [Marivirga sp.]|jgi:hypothetical protein